MPGDPVANLVGAEAGLDEAQLAGIRAELGLDRPWGEQYLRFWSALLRGDLGVSYHFRTDVAALIRQRMGWTLLLVGPSVILGAAAGLLLGAWSGWRPRAAGSRLAHAAALALSSTPPYFLALLLLYALSFRAGLFPLKGFYATGGVLDVAHHLVLPVTVLSLFSAARNFLVMRGGTVQEKGRPYVAFARAKGLRDVKNLGVLHVLRHTARPISSPCHVVTGQLALPSSLFPMYATSAASVTMAPPAVYSCSPNRTVQFPSTYVSFMPSPPPSSLLQSL
jgi:peptide/nickel transport system permease protein